MKKFVVSNRVFWAGVVLASAAIIGRNGGQAAPPSVDAIEARKLTILDAAGNPAITMGTGSNESAILIMGAGGKSGKIEIATEPKKGATVTFSDKDRPTRMITAYASKDISLSVPSVGK